MPRSLKPGKAAANSSATKDKQGGEKRKDRQMNLWLYVATSSHLRTKNLALLLGGDFVV